MKTNIYFVRHAHSIYTTDELNRTLSENGYNAAKIVTNLLLKEKIDYIISSPFKRAIETVEGIARFHNKNIIIDERFRERVLFKEVIEDFEKAVYKAWEDFNFLLEGGESSYEAQIRGVSGIKEIISKYNGKNVVIGTHGNIMVLIMNYYDKKYDYFFWRNLNMPDVYKLTFEDENLLNVKQIWV